METLLAPRRTGRQTREAILTAAAEVFREKSYDVATLEEIASQLGITRSAVLHYFGSKQELLNEIVRPFMARLDEVLDRWATTGRPTPQRRRAILTDLVDFACDNRAIASLLIRDITAHRYLEPQLQLGERIAKFVSTILGVHEEPHAAVAGLAAVGAIVRPVSAPETLIDLSTPGSRQVLVEAGLAALRAGLKTGAASADVLPPA